ncbi:ATP-binding protein [Paenibacillaceae bacterium WGS1546]|uniref:ATP-binding protein n=1 Tax=Cohnella sp. WGS1546 TaxID=3366810 RepID=UPI00372D113E
MLRHSGWRWFVLILASFSVATAFPPSSFAEHSAARIMEWQVRYIERTEDAEFPPASREGWLNADSGQPRTALPKDARGVWVRLLLPPTDDWPRPGLLADRLYGRDLAVYAGQRLLYESTRDYAVDLNKLLLRLDPASEPTELFIRILASEDRAGLVGGLRVDDYDGLSRRFVLVDLPELLLGSALALLSLIMFVCTGFLHRRQRRTWISLCLISFTAGTLIFAYSPLPYYYFDEYGAWLLLMFDVSIFVLLPSLNLFIDQVFEGQYRLFTKFGRFQTGYSLFCLSALAVYQIAGESFHGIYALISIHILGAVIVAQMILIIALSIMHALKANRDAAILLIGIFLLAATAMTDMVLYYLSDRTYILFLWKIGVFALMSSLIVIFARRISADYGMLVNYSKELELYNHRLQRTEKLKIISDLAASVAHEVRNPLQVTRGFLQLLADKTEVKNKPYFDLATNELDRASAIITDFLTFAKPELDTVDVLNAADELRQIEAMMSPLAAMHGTVLAFDCEDGLCFAGNSSKLKQALINMIKNSIEATGNNGMIEVTGAAEGEEIVIRIRDNGEGMDEEQLAKLGVPFFSTKAKGTGLGLMVTYRIVEVMKGTIEFRSVKSGGTEAIVRFPRVGCV